MQIQKEIQLLARNSFQLRSCAEYFVSVVSEEETVEALAYALDKQLSVTVLGAGTNVILPRRIAGLVVSVDIAGQSYAGGRVTAGAGAKSRLRSSSIASCR